MADATATYLMLVSSILTCLGTSIIISAYLFFPYFRRKTYVEIIFYSAMADFLGSLGTVIGRQNDRSAACNFQSFFSNVFQLASILWTLAFAVHVRASVTSLTPPKKVNIHIHFVCWGFPMIVTLLSLTTNRYGLIEGNSWCFLQNRSDSPSWGLAFWTIFSFYFWAILSMLGMIFCLSAIYIWYNVNKSARRRNLQLSEFSFDKLWYYPFIIIFCWTIPTFYDVGYAVSKNDMSTGSLHLDNILSALSFSLPILQGFLTTISFIFSTTFIRHKIYSIFTGYTMFGMTKSSVGYLESNRNENFKVSRRITREIKVHAFSSSNFNNSNKYNFDNLENGKE